MYTDIAIVWDIYLALSDEAGLKRASEQERRKAEEEEKGPLSRPAERHPTLPNRTNPPYLSAR